MRQRQKGEAILAMMVVMLAIWMIAGHGHMGMMAHDEQGAHESAAPTTAPDNSGHH